MDCCGAFTYRASVHGHHFVARRCCPPLDKMMAIIVLVMMVMREHQCRHLARVSLLAGCTTTYGFTTLTQLCCYSMYVPQLPPPPSPRHNSTTHVTRFSPSKYLPLPNLSFYTQQNSVLVTVFYAVDDIETLTFSGHGGGRQRLGGRDRERERGREE